MTENGKKINYTHDGVDITGCPGGPSIDGAEVRPYMEGKVEKVDDKGKGGFGKYVIIDHGNGFKTQYSHLKDVGVKDGQEIKSGDLDTAIGHVDNTGRSNGPHLDLKMYYER
jgi:murein DD-endopeptidase MepM/ murein hydrolase activator NlpD